MELEKIRKLGPVPFAAKIKRILKHREAKESLIVGFDTEYTSKGHNLLSFQLSVSERTGFFETRKPRLSIADILEALATINGDCPPHVTLVTFYSFAELQFLPVEEESTDWREYARSFECEFRGPVKVVIYDLAKLFPGHSLRSAAKALGEAKEEYDTTNVTRASLKDPAFIQYAKHDALLCERLFHSLAQQFASEGADLKLTRTAASTAATIFRASYLTEDIEPPPSAVRFQGLATVWGGRFEALKRGLFAHLVEYDLFSAYPMAAVEIGEFARGHDWKRATDISAHKARGSLLRVRYKFPSDALPCLPVFHAGMLLFPLSGLSFATGYEVSQALSQGADVSLLDGYYYDRGTPDISAFMAQKVKERRELTGAAKEAAKLAMNSLVGKTAQRITDISIEEYRKISAKHRIPIREVITYDTVTLERLGAKSKPAVGPLCWPEVNALITGFVRAQIARLAMLGEAVYIATDAVIFSHRLKATPVGTEIKHEGPGAIVRARMAAIFDPEKEKLAMHGCHAKGTFSEAVKTWDGFGAYETRYTVERAVKMRSALRKGKRFSSWEKLPMILSFAPDKKRRILPNGRDSVPWESIAELDSFSAAC